ncbi:MAG: adenine phosphoribosyltransferase [Candidatus Omnitrophica bacterium]|nr:adenine phosphoribosyltransferase [Candidatus Omnitrophota bacterium]
MDLDKVIRKVPNFPKPGVLFYDVTSVFLNPEAFEHVIGHMEEIYRDTELDGVIAIESRGFLLGAPFALRRSVPLVLARKKGKLPGDTVEQIYTLEYGEATLEIHKSDITGGRWLIVDDLIATGGTLEAVAKMIEHQQAEVAGIFAMIGLTFLDYTEKIGRYEPRTLIDYEGEEVEEQ